MATVPVPRTWVLNEDVTSANMVSGITDPLAFLLAKPRAELRQTVAQTLTTAVAAPLTFTTEDVDTDVAGVGGHDNSSNTSRYTARYAGWYRVSGAASFAANSTGRRITYIAVNGSVVNASETISPASATGSSHALARAKCVYLNVGDYVEIQAMQDSGGNLATSSGFGPSNSNMSIQWEGN